MSGIGSPQTRSEQPLHTSRLHHIVKRPIHSQDRVQEIRIAQRSNERKSILSLSHNSHHPRRIAHQNYGTTPNRRVAAH